MIKMLLWKIKRKLTKFYKQVILQIISFHKKVDYPVGCVNRTQYILTVLHNDFVVLELRTHYPCYWWDN